MIFSHLRSTVALVFSAAMFFAISSDANAQSYSYDNYAAPSCANGQCSGSVQSASTYNNYVVTNPMTYGNGYSNYAPTYSQPSNYVQSSSIQTSYNHPLWNGTTGYVGGSVQGSYSYPSSGNYGGDSYYGNSYGGSSCGGSCYGGSCGG